jgi:hypothetical protein
MKRHLYTSIILLGLCLNLFSVNTLSSQALSAPNNFFSTLKYQVRHPECIENENLKCDVYSFENITDDLNSTWGVKNNEIVYDEVSGKSHHETKDFFKNSSVFAEFEKNKQITTYNLAKLNYFSPKNLYLLNRVILI